VTIGDASGVDYFEAAIAAILPTSTTGHENTLRGAIEAAALRYPNSALKGAKAINRRLKQLGVEADPARTASQIRNVAGLSQVKIPAEIAARFCDHLRDEADLPSDSPVLLFHYQDFWRWSCGRWRSVDPKRMQALVARFCQLELGIKGTGQLFRDVLANLQGLVLLDCQPDRAHFLIEDLEGSKASLRDWVVFGNGAIDLAKVIAGRAPKLFEPTSSYFTQTVVPYHYDPRLQCKLWLQTLNDILPKSGVDDHRQEVLQEFFGYSLLGDCRFQKLIVLLGEGGNGKSTISRVWEKMLGESNVSAVALDALGDRFRLSALVGKLANFSGELCYLGRVNEGILKLLVSGDSIDIDRKNRDSVKVRLSTKLIVSTNELPSIRDPTNATFDRFIVLPFEVRIRGTEREDKTRATRLEQELPGILNWALHGLQRLLRQDSFTRCARCAAALHEHCETTDQVRAFINECCVPNQNCQLCSSGLYRLFRCSTTESGRHPIASNEFGKRLKNLGYEKKRGPKQGKLRHPTIASLALSPAGQSLWRRLNRKESLSDPIEFKVSR